MKKLNKIYVVTRLTGEYSDRTETLVCWFESELAAKNFIEAATHNSVAAYNTWETRGLDFWDKERDPTTKAFYKRWRACLVDQTYDPSAYGADDPTYHYDAVERGEWEKK